MKTKGKDMKKFLSILSAVGLTATASTSVVACGNKETTKVVENNTHTPITDVQEELCSAKQALDDVQTQINDVLNGLDNAKATIAFEQDKLKSAQEDVEHFEELKKTVDTTIDQAKVILKEQQSTQKTLNDLQELIESTHADNTNGVGVIKSALKEFIKANNSQIETTTNEIKELSLQATEVQKSLEKSKQDLKETTTKVDAIVVKQTQDINNLNAKKAKLEGLKKDWESKVKELEDQLNALRK